MKTLGVILMIVGTIGIWGFSIATGISILACIAKMLGVSAAAGVSYFLPLKALGGVLLSGVLGSIGMATTCK